MKKFLVDTIAAVRFVSISSLVLADGIDEPIPSFYQEAGLPQNRPVIAHESRERIDPFTGKLQWHFVDVMIPGNGGLDIAVCASVRSRTAAAWSIESVRRMAGQRSKCRILLAPKRMNSDMDQKTVSNSNLFQIWPGNQPLFSGQCEIGAIQHLAHGVLELLLVRARDKSRLGSLHFEAPLVTRVTDAGNLSVYWNSGFAVCGYNIFVSDCSALLSWLEESSGGAHQRNETKHYAVFTDDVCVEVLSRVPPKWIEAYIDAEQTDAQSPCQ